jgi:hypothetical protein
METVNLISEVDLMQITSISDNADVNAIRPFIYNSQMKYIRELVGSAMYDDMLLDKSTGGTKYEFLNQNYTLFVLGYYAWYDYAPFAHYKFQKKGIVKQTSDDSTSVDLEELSLVLKRIESNAVYYYNLMREYLEANKTLYPLYRGSDCDSTYKSSGSGVFLKFGTNNKYSYNPNSGNYI